MFKEERGILMVYLKESISYQIMSEGLLLENNQLILKQYNNS
ncbi:hypothetical protein SATMO3_18730 [Sporomusa aerivorans]